MNFHNDDFCNRIIFKKNAINALCEIINEIPQKGKVFFLSSRSAYQKFGIFVVNQIVRAGKEFKSLSIHSVCDYNTIQKVLDMMKGCSVIVALGGGSICDLAKMVGKILNLKVILVVSAPSTSAYFSKYSLVSNHSLKKCYECDYASKIIIDENFIIAADETLVTNGIGFVLSFFEKVFSFEIDRLFFEKEEKFEIISSLNKFKENLDNLKTQSADSKLVLTDILIDLGYFLKDVIPTTLTNLNFSFLLQNSKAIQAPFGILCLISAKIILECYKNFLNQKKIEILNFLNLEKIHTNLKLFNINIRLNARLIKVTNKQFFLKLFTIKEKLLNQINNISQEFQQFDFKCRAVVDFEKCLKCLNVLPIITNCNILFSTIASMGFLNF